MALPKSRHSKARTRSRRAKWKIEAPSLLLCPNCGAYKLRHVACPQCGYYMGRSVIDVKKGKK